MDKSTAIFFPHSTLRYKRSRPARPAVLPPPLASGVKQPVNRPLPDCIRFDAVPAACLSLRRHVTVRPHRLSPKSQKNSRRIPEMTTGFTVIRDTTPATAIPRGAVVAMGHFAGVHLGHRAVIAAALQMGKAHGKPAFAVTFEPHPRSFFSPNSPQFRLTDEANKLRLLAGTGLDGAVVMTFDKGRAGTRAQAFIHHDPIGRLGISGIAVGYDFHFGKGRVGSPSLLGSRAPPLRLRGALH